LYVLVNAAANGVMLRLRHNFYNIIFKIKHKLYVASELNPPAPPPMKNSGCAPKRRKYSHQF